MSNGLLVSNFVLQKNIPLETLQRKKVLDVILQEIVKKKNYGEKECILIMPVINTGMDKHLRNFLLYTQHIFI